MLCSCTAQSSQGSVQHVIGHSARLAPLTRRLPSCWHRVPQPSASERSPQNSAVSHSSKAAKSSIQVTWRPDSGFNQTIQFRATFLKSFDTYWMDKVSPTVTFNGTSGSSSQGSSTVRPSTTLSAAPLSLFLMILFSYIL